MQDCFYCQDSAVEHCATASILLSGTNIPKETVPSAFNEHDVTEQIAERLSSVDISGVQVSSLSTEAVHARREHCTPPALPRRSPIALPVLSADPILTHPLLTAMHPTVNSNAPLIWNVLLPPAFARLAPDLSGEGNSSWAYEPALEPLTAESMVIRIPGVEDPAVIFPTRMGEPISITNVLDGIYAVLRGTGAVECVRESTFDSANGVTELMRRPVYWGGLRECSIEQEVWILQLFDNVRGGNEVIGFVDRL